MSDTRPRGAVLRLAAAAVVCWHGPVNDASVPALREALTLAADEPGPVTVVAHDITSMNGAGLSELAGAPVTLQSRGDFLWVASPPCTLAVLRQRTGLQAVMPCRVAPPPSWSDPCLPTARPRWRSAYLGHMSAEVAEVTERLVAEFEGRLPRPVIGDVVLLADRDLTGGPAGPRAELLERAARQRLLDLLPE